MPKPLHIQAKTIKKSVNTIWSCICFKGYRKDHAIIQCKKNMALTSSLLQRLKCEEKAMVIVSLLNGNCGG